jgi:NAD-dependent dihydropyrimidine dehydrogenase PreA subunit
MANRLTVVVSQSRSPHPKKRALEEQLVMELLGRKNIEINVTAHLYDLPANSTDMLCLAGISGDLVVCSWLYPRAARWILDRNGILGQEGASLLKAAGEDEESSEDEGQQDGEEEKIRVINLRTLPTRHIYCLDLRAHDSAAIYLEEIERIFSEQKTQVLELGDWIQGNPKPEQMQRFLAPENGQALNNGQAPENGRALNNGQGLENGRAPENGAHDASPSPQMISQEEESQNKENSQDPLSIVQHPEPVDRRWYPVIDYSRCTNCLECIDFCLFGVYGMDRQETILVEQPDNCRLGCPACSRVCPENAIIFPQHKAPTIAGSPEIGGSMKIDLSQLFGAPSGSPVTSPETGSSGTGSEEEALDTAIRERDEQLRLAGREEVGLTMGLPIQSSERQSSDQQASDQQESDQQSGPQATVPSAQSQGEPAGKLDRLIDALDELEL